MGKKKTGPGERNRFLIHSSQSRTLFWILSLPVVQLLLPTHVPLMRASEWTVSENQTRWDVLTSESPNTWGSETRETEAHRRLRAKQAAVDLLSVCFTSGSSRWAASRVWDAESGGDCTHAEEGGEAHAVVADGKVVRFGPDDLHYVLIELGLLPLVGDTMGIFTGTETRTLCLFFDPYWGFSWCTFYHAPMQTFIMLNNYNNTFQSKHHNCRSLTDLWAFRNYNVISSRRCLL